MLVLRRGGGGAGDDNALDNTREDRHQLDLGRRRGRTIDSSSSDKERPLIVSEMFAVLNNASAANRLGHRGRGGEKEEKDEETLIALSDFLTHAACVRGRFLAVVRLFPVNHKDPIQLVEMHPVNGIFVSAEDDEDDEESRLRREQSMSTLHEATALQWFDDNRLIVGFRSGAIHVYDATRLIRLHAQVFRPTPVVRIKRAERTILRHPHTSTPASSTTFFEEVWYLHQDHVVVGHTASDMDRVATTTRRRRRDRDNDDNDESMIDHRSWKLISSQESMTDFCVRMPRRASLFDLRPRSDRATILATGKAVPLAMYEGLSVGNRNIGVSALASAAAKRLTRTVSAIIPSWIKRHTRGAERTIEKEIKRRADVVVRRIGPGRVFRDELREMTSISTDPSGQLCVTTDNLGRVMLLDAENMRVLRMWKGYRDAQCGWVQHDADDDGEEELTERPREKVESPALRRHRSSIGSLGDERHHSHSGLYLVIYTPGRAVVELWRMQHGPRVDSITVVPPTGSTSSCRLFTVQIPILSRLLDSDDGGKRKCRTPYRVRCMMLVESSDHDGVREGENETLKKTSHARQTDVWELYEVVLTRRARAVVRRHYESVADQRQYLALIRIRTDLETMAKEQSAMREELKSTIAASLSELHNVSHIERAALELECPSITTDDDAFYKTCIQRLIVSLDAGDQQSDEEDEGEEEDDDTMDRSTKRDSYRTRRRAKTRRMLSRNMRLYDLWSSLRRDIESTTTALATIESEKGDEGGDNEDEMWLSLLAREDNQFTRESNKSEDSNDLSSFAGFRSDADRLQDAYRKFDFVSTSHIDVRSVEKCSRHLSRLLFEPIVRACATSSAQYTDAVLRRRTFDTLSHALFQDETSNESGVSSLAHSMQRMWLCVVFAVWFMRTSSDVIGWYHRTTHRAKLYSYLIGLSRGVGACREVMWRVVRDASVTRRQSRRSLALSLLCRAVFKSESTCLDRWIETCNAARTAFVFTACIKRDLSSATVGQLSTKSVSLLRDFLANEYLERMTDDKMMEESSSSFQLHTEQTRRMIAIVCGAREGSVDGFRCLQMAARDAPNVCPILTRAVQWDELNVHRAQVLLSTWKSSRSGTKDDVLGDVSIIDRIVALIDAIPTSSRFKSAVCFACWHDNLRLGARDMFRLDRSKRRKSADSCDDVDDVRFERRRCRFVNQCQQILRLLRRELEINRHTSSTVKRDNMDDSDDDDILCSKWIASYETKKPTVAIVSHYVLLFRVWETIIALGLSKRSLPTDYLLSNNINHEDDIFGERCLVDATTTEWCVESKRCEVLLRSLATKLTTAVDIASVRHAYERTSVLAKDLKMEQFCTRMFVRIMFARGDDVTARSLLGTLADDVNAKRELGRSLLPVVERRLCTIVRICRSSAKHVPLLACVDDDIALRLSRKSTSDEPTSPQQSESYTLAMTTSMLRDVSRLLRGSDRESVEWVNQMLTLSSSLLSAARERKLVLDASRQRPRSGTRLFNTSTDAVSSRGRPGGIVMGEPRRRKQSENHEDEGEGTDEDESGDWV